MTPIAASIFTALVTVALAGLVLVLRPVFPHPVRIPATHQAITEDDAPPQAIYPPPPAAPREPAPRGSLAPATVNLIPMMISQFCSGGACALCPGDGCEHDCDHNTAKIAGRNQVDYDLAHPRKAAA